MRYFLFFLLISLNSFAATTVRFECVHDGATRHGTAFGIDVSKWGYKDKCYLLTAAHNVVAGSDIRINKGNLWPKCTVEAIDPELDICLLKCEEDVANLELADKDAHNGEEIKMIGSKKAGDIKEYKGKIVKQYYEKFCTTLMKVEDFDHGHSGGPILDVLGKVIGMVVAGIPNKHSNDPFDNMEHDKGTFLPVSAIESFLYDHKKEPFVVTSPQFRPSSDVIFVQPDR